MYHQLKLNIVVVQDHQTPHKNWQYHRNHKTSLIYLAHQLSKLLLHHIVFIIERGKGLLSTKTSSYCWTRIYHDNWKRTDWQIKNAAINNIKKEYEDILLG